MAIDKTLLVISASKLVERFSSAALSSLLNIDLKDSKTLSNKNSAFSFKQKLDLLTDIKAFDKTELQKFQTFTEIRNQFAHNFEVDDFESCFSFLDGAENYLKKKFPAITSEGKSHEDFLFELFKALFNNIMEHCYDILSVVTAKISKEVSEKVTKETYEDLINSIKTYAENTPEFKDIYNKILDDVFHKKGSK